MPVTVAVVPEQPTGIVTPEAVVLEFETAGTASRILGGALDVLIQGVAIFVLAFATSFAASGLQGAGSWVAAVVLVLAMFLVLIGYPVAMETLWNGRTLGKAAAGTRVVTVEGGPVRFRHAAIRAAVGLLELWSLAGMVATLATILTRRSQRLGDMVAGTVVVRERTGATTLAALRFVPPPGYEAYAATLDVNRLSEAQYGLVRSFLTRVFEVTPMARARLALELANPIAVAMHHTPPPMVGPELFLVCVAAAYQRRHGGPEPLPAPSYGPPGYGPPGYGPPGYGPPSYGPPGYGPPGYGPPGYGPPGYGAPGYGPPTGPAYGAPLGWGPGNDRPPDRDAPVP